MDDSPLTRLRIEAAALEARAAWLRRDTQQQATLNLSQDDYSGFRRLAYREAVEARLALHGRTVDQLLGSIAGRAGPSVRTELQAVITWVVGDRQRIIRDLFARLEFRPSLAGPRERPVVPTPPEARD